MLEYVKVEQLVLLGAHSPVLGRDIARFGAVDALTVTGKPLTNGLKPFQSLLRKGAVRTRTYVEKQVGSLACRLHQVADQVFG